MEQDPRENAELSTARNYVYLRDLLNGLSAVPPPEEEKPLDKVKEPPDPWRSREREER